MERRCLLSASPLPIHLGMVYYEDASGRDEAGDQFEVTFDGGAPGTQLAELTIQTDKVGDGLTIGDVFFDVDAAGLGAFGAVPLQIVSRDGIDSVDAYVVDGGTSLVFQFSGFDPGDRLLFTIDVDEQGFLGPNAVAEGNEVEGSQLTARFTAPNYYEATGGDIFIDFYQDELDALALDLPPDSYIPPGEVATPVRTAAALFPVTQTPLPIRIAGTVFEDVDLDNAQDPGESGLPGVELGLFEWQAGEWKATGRTAQTDGDGHYRFDDLLPGTYRVVETQPDGWFSVGATAGSVNGIQRGTVAGADAITDVALLGGEDSVGNDFAEARPVSLGGHVYHDADNDGIFDAGETGIGGVTIRVYFLPSEGPPPPPIETLSADDGSWQIDGLVPGAYFVAEVQPGGYLDGLDTAGTAGGTAHNPGDRIDDVQLSSGQSGRQYNFGELLPNSIAGLVVLDGNGNGLIDPGEIPLAGVTLLLFDGSGSQLATTQTDANGRYLFAGLASGVYRVAELQPDGYYDGADLVGSVGGVVTSNDVISGITLVSATAAVEYDFCEIPPACLGGYVYLDADNDGVRDPDEVGIGGVELSLLDADGQATGVTTVTDSTGFYRFCGLMPGRYGVAETQPDGYLDGQDTPGTGGGVAENPGDAIRGITLTPGARAAENNFGERPIPIDPPEPPDPPDDPPVFPPDNPDPWEPLPRPKGIEPALVHWSVLQTVEMTVVPLLPRYGGGPITHYPVTWHLSVVNGGRPRRDSSGNGYDSVAEAAGARFSTASWMDIDARESQWIMADSQGQPAQKFDFGLAESTPVTGDWNGDGAVEIGVYVDGLWLLDLNGNGVWEEGDLWIRLGSSTDMPVVGDWDGDGKSDIGIFGPAWPDDPWAVAAEPGLPDIANDSTGGYKNIPPDVQQRATVGWRTMKRTSEGDLRADVVDHVFEYGGAGDIAVAGDFNGDGVATIGVFRGGRWYLDADGDGRWGPGDIYIERFGSPGDVPLVGDFNGDGIDDLGVFRDGFWSLDIDGDRELTARDRYFRLGNAGDKPAVGDFNGDGVDEVALCRDGAGASSGQASTASPDQTPEVASSQGRPSAQ